MTKEERIIITKNKMIELTNGEVSGFVEKARNRKQNRSKMKSEKHKALIKGIVKMSLETIGKAINKPKELTLKYAIKYKLTAFDCVRFFDPSLSDKECDSIVWEDTCFPMSNEIFIEQLNEYFKNRTK